MIKRPVSLVLLALTLSTVAFAQRNPAPLTRRELDAAADAAIERDPRLAREREEVDRKMLEMRESIINDSIQKMNSRRFENNNSEYMHRLIGDIGAFLVFVILLSSLLWIINKILETRRWNRVAAIQTEIHNKLLERMASNQELLAYMETEAGKRFLESSPFEVERPRNPAFPYGRILLSAQAGIVALSIGAGLIWLQDRLPDYSQPLLVFGTLGLALGVGLVISAFMAYSMSKHFGLTQGTQE